MVDGLEYKQKGLWSDIENEKSSEDRECLQIGNRLSVSQIEKIIPLFNQSMEYSNEYDILQILKINNQGTWSEKEAERSAHFSIYGTQLHYLQYFYQLFSRVEGLGREIDMSDFKKTFMFRDRDYLNGLGRIIDIAREEGNLDFLGYWNSWRMNGHEFSIPNNVVSVLSPTKIRDIWEGYTVNMMDIDKFFKSVDKIDSDKLDHEKSLVINEAMFITNFYIGGSNLQVPTAIDELVIPKNFPDTAMTLIDYKTGKQFKDVHNIEKIQIFLMISAVLLAMVDKIEKIQWVDGQWEIAHAKHSLPFITKSSLRNISINNVCEEDLLAIHRNFKNSIKFKYVNPLTQESIEVTSKDIGIDSEEGIEDIMGYLGGMNNFYSKYKEIIKPKLRSKYVPYILPKFSYKDFNKGNVVKNVIQPKLVCK